MSADPVASAAALAAAVVFGAIGLLHAYWALGGYWPGTDADSLSRTVIGGPAGMRGPGPAATWAVVAVLLGAILVVLSAAHLVSLGAPPWLVRSAAWFGAAVLFLRGLEGFVDARVRPQTVGSRFEQLNVRVYSPLFVVLSVLTFLAAR